MLQWPVVLPNAFISSASTYLIPTGTYGGSGSQRTTIIEQCDNMTRAIAKIQRKISKKGKTASLHEKSRDAKKLRRAVARAEKLNSQATRKAKLNQYYGILKTKSCD